MSCAACGIRHTQPRTLKTSHQILFCSLVFVLETCQSRLNFSCLRVGGILLPCIFIVLIPENWLKNSATKEVQSKINDDLRWRWQRWKIIMLGCSFEVSFWPSGTVLGSTCCRLWVKQSVLCSQVGQSRADLVPWCPASETEGVF